jgi:hypothetical protein
MHASSSHWNIVVLGYWNRAILTPAGIAHRLFKLDDTTPVEVYVPVNVSEPHKVAHKGIQVTVPPGRLMIDPAGATFPQLAEAADVAVNALVSLPETPVTAVGLNVRYHIEDPTDEFLDLLGRRLDDALSDSDQIVLGRVIQRSIQDRDCVLNLKLERPVEGPIEIEFNFHKATTVPEEMSDWIKNRASDLEPSVNAILSRTFRMDNNGVTTDG